MNGHAEYISDHPNRKVTRGHTYFQVLSLLNLYKQKNIILSRYQKARRGLWVASQIGP